MQYEVLRTVTVPDGKRQAVLAGDCVQDGRVVRVVAETDRGTVYAVSDPKGFLVAIDLHPNLDIQTLDALQEQHGAYEVGNTQDRVVAVPASRRKAFLEALKELPDPAV